MTGGPPRPPALARWLRDRLVPPEWRDAYAGDLDEQHALDARTSRRAADRAYRREVARLMLARAWSNVSLLRDAFSGVTFLTLASDLRYSLRHLQRRPMDALLIVLVLGISLGLGAGALGLVHAYLWTPLPYPHGDRIVTMRLGGPGLPMPDGVMRTDWAGARDVADLIVSWDIDGFTLVGDDRPQTASGRWIGGDVFEMFDVRPVLGRTFTTEESERGDRVAVISQRLWHERYGGAPDVIGRSMTVRSTDRPDEAEVMMIVGVLPPRFWPLDDRTDVLLPLAGRRPPSLVRLREGVTPEQASERLTQLVRAHSSNPDPRWLVSVLPLRETHVAPVRDALETIALAVALLVLVSVGNLVFLQMARGLARQRELAVRAAIGGTRGRILRQLIVEHALLTLGVTAVAVTAGFGVVAFGLPVVEEFTGRLRPDPAGAGWLAWALATSGIASLAFLASLVSGVLPAWSVLRRSLAPAMAGHASTTASPRQTWLRHAIVGVQVAATFALLAGAALMVQSARHLAQIDLGYDPAGVISANLSPHERSYEDVERRRDLLQRVVTAIESLPGVEAAGVIAGWPTGIAPGSPVRAADAGVDREPALAVRRAVNPAYFRALRLPMLEGRPLQPADVTAGDTNVVISESLARALWPGESAVGRMVRAGGGTTMMGQPIPVTELRVVGVTRDVARGLLAPSPPEIYSSIDRAPNLFWFLQVRASGDTTSQIRAIERAVLGADPNLPLDDPRPLEAILAREGLLPRLLANVLSAFALFGAGVALVGVYAVSAWLANQRRREAALRLALGATASAVARAFVGRGAVVVGVGLAVGWLLAGTLGSFLSALLFGVTAGDVATRLAVGIVLGVVCLVALWWPARRAGAADPAVLLREP